MNPMAKARGLLRPIHDQPKSFGDYVSEVMAPTNACQSVALPPLFMLP